MWHRSASADLLCLFLSLTHLNGHAFCYRPAAQITRRGIAPAELTDWVQGEEMATKCIHDYWFPLDFVLLYWPASTVVVVGSPQCAFLSSSLELIPFKIIIINNRRDQPTCTRELLQLLLLLPTKESHYLHPSLGHQQQQPQPWTAQFFTTIANPFLCLVWPVNYYNSLESIRGAKEFLRDDH